MRAITLRQPWPFAVLHGKPVENRTWYTAHRGPIALHAGAAIDAYDGDKGAYALQRVAELTGLPLSAVVAGSAVRKAVVAVVTITGVCERSRHSRHAGSLLCDCGPWAATRQNHFLLADVRPLPEPIPCRGFQKIWDLPEGVAAAVHAALGVAAGGCPAW